jgi:hypothetical protein
MVVEVVADADRYILEAVSQERSSSLRTCVECGAATGGDGGPTNTPAIPDDTYAGVHDYVQIARRAQR